jgi:hypothetical protein
MQDLRYIIEMNKIIVTTTVCIALATTLVAGCSRGNSQPASTPPAPGNSASAPSQALPPTTASGGNTVVQPDMLQDNIPLSVTEPLDAASIAASRVAVKGRTKPGAVVNVNDEIGTADANGNFSVSISLDEGPNAIDVIAADDSGKESELLLLVNSVPPDVPSAGNSAPAAEYSDGSVPIKVSQPADSSTLTSDTVVVKGQTVPGAMVSVNDETDFADANGNFSISISLDPGPNAIDVVAFDEEGNDGEIILIVNVVA